MDFIGAFLDETIHILEAVSRQQVAATIDLLEDTRRQGGRLFVLGVGGSAANASHAVNDFRKLCDIEAYSPTDNVSELTARINDDGWETCFANWLIGSRLSSKDMVLVLSVGGGDVEKGVSLNLVRALELARGVGARISGIVGRNGGFTAQLSAATIVVPSPASGRVTPQTEAMQAVIWHLLVSHPKLQRAPAKWEAVGGR